MKPFYILFHRNIFLSLFVLLLEVSALSAQVLQPHILSFSPDTATDLRLVTIKGFNLTGITAVRFGNTAAASFGVANDSTLNAIVGAGSSGYIVVSAGVMTDSLAGFTYVPNIPMIQSFSPTVGATGTVVRINGNHLNGTTAVTFGGTPASFVAVHDDRLVSAFVANGSSGYVTITTNYGKDSLGGFVFQDSTISPLITSFSPVSASQGSVVLIVGKHFLGTSSVMFGGVEAASFSVQSDSGILAVVGPGASGNVQVTTGLGSHSLAGFVFINAQPHIYAFSPDSATTGDQVLITGKNLLGISAVRFGQSSATAISILNDSTLKATVGAGGSGYVVISSGPVSDSLPGFVYIPLTPQIISFSPNYGTTGTVVIIHGFHLSTTTGVNFGGTPATFIAVKDDNTVSAFVGSGSTGFVTIHTPAKSDSLAGFTFSDSLPKPVIQSFSPDSAGQGAIVMIRGIHLLHTISVSFGGLPVASYSAISDSNLMVVVGNAASGDVVVNTSEGSDTLSGFVFLHIQPFINSFTPDSGSAGTNITITGKYLSGVTSIRFGGLPAASFFIANDSTIIAKPGAGSSGYVVVASGFLTDSLPGFIYQPATPKIISFSPKIASSGGLVRFQGLHFTGITGITFGGTPALYFNVRDDNTISAAVGQGSSGSVAVFTATGSDSLVGFIYSSGSVQPNPASNSITVVFPATAGVTRVTLQNTVGNELRSVPVLPNATTATLNISGVPPGIYVVSWGNGANAENHLLMVQ